MRAARDALFFLIAAAALPLACGHGDASRSRQRGPPDRAARLSQVPVRGFLATVATHSGKELRGELLAVDRGLIWLYQPVGDRLSVAVGDVKAVTITYAGNEDAVAYGAWTGLGALSTLSHGWAALVTAPTWLVVGGAVTTFAAFGDAKVVLAPTDTEALRQYARFPQGLPVGDAALH